MGKLIFTKYSNERARQYAIRTDILEEGENRYVKKRALYPQGVDHIYKIEQWYHHLEKRYGNTRISMNRCGLQEDGLLLEYLSGMTLEEELDQLLAMGKIQQLVDILMDYLEEVKKGFRLDHFTMTPEFQKVFGNVRLPENLRSGDVVDIDMVLNNVVADRGWTLIDYEWTFAFPIPCNFVIYRILLYYLNGNSSRNCLHQFHLMEAAGLTAEEISVYEKMERHFQEIYVVEDREGHHVPVRDLYDGISPGVVDLTNMALQQQSERDARMVQLYQAPDLGFSEEYSEKKGLHKEGIFLNAFYVRPESRYVRLDPCSKYCIVKNLRMQWGESVTCYRTNGIQKEDGSILFPTEDPQIIVERPEEGGDDFRAYFQVEYLDAEEALYETQRAYSLQYRELTQARQALEEESHNMENTKARKAFRKRKER